MICQISLEKRTMMMIDGGDMNGLSRRIEKYFE
jgi:hypothetical protein